MAYSTPSVTRFSGHSPNPDLYEVTISGTSIGPSTEVEISGIPKTGKVLSIKTFTSTAGGGAATTQPIIGTLTNPAGGTQAVFRAASTGAIGTVIQAIPTNGYMPYYSSTGSLFYRGATDAGTCSENVVIYISAGWE
tara:strand:+ start:31795 stop:32205 length:411 start_codon:yes stop_codon:yes gene_type:complete